MLAVNDWIESVLCGQQLSFLACINLLWPCSLTETSDRVKWDSLISKDFTLFWSLESVTEAKRSREDGDINKFIQLDVPILPICFAVSYRFFIVTVRSRNSATILVHRTKVHM